MTGNNHTRQYWHYEYEVASRYMVPLLEEWGVPVRDAEMIDVGCGEGGGVCAFHDHGARCVGFDVDEGRVRAGEQLKEARAIPLRVGNLYTPPAPFSGRQFDLVVLHDVFEHLDFKDDMMSLLKGYMKPGGRMMMTFPPYYSAYGAHQQHLRAPFAKLPFFHLIPFSLSFIVPRLRNEDPAIVEEVRKIGRLKMGMRTFERIVARSGMQITRKRAYLISPNHIRFGLKPLPAGPLATIPILNEVLCSGVVYLLSQEFPRSR